MSEKIDLTKYNENGVHFLFDAMGVALGAGRFEEILEKSGLPAPKCYQTCDVVLTINGVEVSFTKSIDNIYEAIDALVEARTKRKLEEMTLGRIEALEDTLRKAKDDVEYRLNLFLNESKGQNIE